MKRDSALWWIGMALPILVFLSDQTGWDLLKAAWVNIGPEWAARIKIASSVVGMVSAYLRMSPLPLDPQGPNAGQPSDPNKTLSITGKQDGML